MSACLQQLRLFTNLEERNKWPRCPKSPCSSVDRAFAGVRKVVGSNLVMGSEFFSEYCWFEKNADRSYKLINSLDILQLITLKFDGKMFQ